MVHMRLYLVYILTFINIHLHRIYRTSASWLINIWSISTFTEAVILNNMIHLCSWARKIKSVRKTRPTHPFCFKAPSRAQSFLDFLHQPIEDIVTHFSLSHRAGGCFNTKLIKLTFGLWSVFGLWSRGHRLSSGIKDMVQITAAPHVNYWSSLTSSDGWR